MGADPSGRAGQRARPHRAEQLPRQGQSTSLPPALHAPTSRLEAHSTRFAN